MCTKGLDEREILRNAYELLSAFDELVTLGYRENLSIGQIKTFLEMESHEERIQEIISRVCLGYVFCFYCGASSSYPILPNIPTLMIEHSLMGSGGEGENNRIKNSKQLKNASEKPNNSNSNGRKWPATNAMQQPFPAPTRYFQATLLPPARLPHPPIPMTRTKQKRINPSSRSSLLSSNIPSIRRGRQKEEANLGTPK